MAMRISSLGGGRYRTWQARTGALGGRPPGTEQPVNPANQLPGRSYCACGRRLNANNRSGNCRTCAPHGRPTDG